MSGRKRPGIGALPDAGQGALRKEIFEFAAGGDRHARRRR
jgi:hypothetical protein